MQAPMYTVGTTVRIGKELEKGGRRRRKRARGSGGGGGIYCRVDTSLYRRMLLGLPSDALLHVLERIATSDLLAGVAPTCRTLHDATTSDALWRSMTASHFATILRSTLFDGDLPLPPPPMTWREHYLTFAETFLTHASERGRVALIVDGVVYDVTAYLPDHPGDPEVLAAAAGQDASAVFEAVGHSANARRSAPAPPRSAPPCPAPLGRRAPPPPLPSRARPSSRVASPNMLHAWHPRAARRVGCTSCLRPRSPSHFRRRAAGGAAAARDRPVVPARARLHIRWPEHPGRLALSQPPYGARSPSVKPDGATEPLRPLQRPDRGPPRLPAPLTRDLEARSGGGGRARGRHTGWCAGAFGLRQGSGYASARSLAIPGELNLGARMCASPEHPGHAPNTAIHTATERSARPGPHRGWRRWHPRSQRYACATGQAHGTGGGKIHTSGFRLAKTFGIRHTFNPLYAQSVNPFPSTEI